MVDSNYVYRIKSELRPLIQQAQNCSSDMTQATRDINSYWVGLGGPLHEQQCRQWVSSMNQLRTRLIILESSLGSYADQLRNEENAHQAAMAAYWASRSN